MTDIIHEKNLEYRDNKILVIEKKELHWRTIKNYRNKLTTKIGRLTQDLVETEDNVNRIKFKIASLDKELMKLNSDEVNKIIQTQKEDEDTANQRALDLLREHIGLAAFTELMEKHRIYWNHKDVKYKMSDKGRVYRHENKKWKELCIIRPSLPLPDSILAIFLSVKNNPSKYPNRRVR